MQLVDFCVSEEKLPIFLYLHLIEFVFQVIP